MTTTKTYHLKQLAPAPLGMKAVYYVDERDGGPKLASWPIDMLGLATEEVREYGDSTAELMSTTWHEGAIVGLTLSEGYWHICNEDENFAGLMMEGQNIRECTGCLDYEYRKRLNEAMENE